MEAVKTSHISGTRRPIFFTLSPYALKNNGLINKNHWEDLDIIDRGHCKDDVSQFCLYLGNHLTNFNEISTTMMASRPVKNLILTM